MDRKYDRNYFLWLLQKVEWYEIDAYEYKELLWLLFTYDFTWTIENDANRAAKGINLRYEYLQRGDYSKRPCSVLEMLIALAHDWEHEITYDFQKGDRSALWFWVMLENLGLLDPPVFHQKSGEPPENLVNHQIFGEIIGGWLGREFREDGVGSPFPLKFPPDNQKKVEIWQQLQSYVIENVEF